VLSLADRILVMREGRLVATFDQGEASEERIIAAATGQTEGGGQVGTEPA
jgi:ABC-type sugar transport system ATPase subunit